jgi:hypothetical protein
MSIAVSPVYQFSDVALAGQILHYAKLNVTGITASASPGTQNTIPHSLTDGKGSAVTPIQVSIEPTSLPTFYEYQAADATNIYVTATGTSGSNYTVTLYVTY